jgi:hypothetical protein
VVVECLTGRQCYPGSQVESVIARLHRRPSIPQELPGWLRDVLGAMTATEPIRRPEAAAVADALRRRDAEPAVAATVPLALHARTGVVPAGAVDPMVTARDAAPADATAEFPAGMPRTGALRLTSMRGATTIVGGSLVFLVVALLLAWMVSGADRPASGRRDDPATTSSTATVPTTVAPILPTPPEAPPAVGQDNGGGSGDGRSNGNGQGSGKGKKGG